MASKETNRIKVDHLEQKKTSKWLAEKLGVNEPTGLYWCSNNTKPPVETKSDIAKLHNVDIRELLSSTKKNSKRWKKETV